MDKIVVTAPAKINIGLNIVAKRADGFHNIETIFYPLDLSDELTFSKADEFVFSSNDENLNKEKTNLIIKAKELLENFCNKKFSVKIYLNKNIPIGAGLGGGSSNAASTLIALNKFYDLNIDEKDLSKLALQLGSDVPFFINPVPSFAESRGENLHPLNLKINKYLLLVNPGIHVATKWAFSLIKPYTPEISLKKFIDSNEITIDEVMKIAYNDFEKIVFDHHHQIREVKEEMLGFGAVYSMMTGTGSTVWAMFDDEEAAYQTELFFKCKNYFTYIQEPI